MGGGCRILYKTEEVWSSYRLRKGRRRKDQVKDRQVKRECWNLLPQLHLHPKVILRMDLVLLQGTPYAPSWQCAFAIYFLCMSLFSHWTAKELLFHLFCSHSQKRKHKRQDYLCSFFKVLRYKLLFLAYPGLHSTIM